MGLYLYCLGTADHPPPRSAHGLADGPVSALETAGLSAWVSSLDAAPKPTLESARRHNQVVESACAEKTALPVRFGQWFPDRSALDALVLARRDALLAGLRRVAGALEMGTRIVDPGVPAAPPDRSTGRAYLESLAQREAKGRSARQRGEALAEELRQGLGALVRDQRARPLGTAEGLVAIAHLVDRHDIGNYTARVRALAERHADLRFLTSGPWPPYGFADDERTGSA